LIGADSWARRFASLPGTVTPSGITLDATGHFGHELLVTMLTQPRGDHCAGPWNARGVHVITGHAPVMEGGIAVAPASFGRYGGDLVAPGETGGPVFVIGSPRRPVAPGAGAGGRLTDVLPEVATCFHRPAGTPRPKLMTEAD
jgi:hypothetical protein